MLGDRREAFYDDLLKESGPRYANYDSVSIHLSLSVIFTCDILQQLVSCEFATYGLSRSTFNILMLLRHGPAEGMQLHNLGELLLVSRANVTGLMDHLEQRKFVTRTVDAADRRARFARITSSGEALLDKLVPAHYQTIRSLLQEMTAPEKETLLGLLKRMRESLVAGRERCTTDLPAEIKTK